MRIEKLKAEHNVKVEWVHFPLHPDTPAEGRALSALFGGRDEDRRARHAQMKARMTGEGLPYGERTMTYNSRLAQELGKWADTQPGGEALHDALFRAYFEAAKDIGDAAVLQKIADEAGVTGWPGQQDQPAVAEKEERVRELGISGVPTFIFNRESGISGAYPAEMLAQAIKEAAATNPAQRDPK